jgi:hypothetical protein
VNVTNENGCQSQSSITVYFSFDACVGIGEMQMTGKILIYPNPSEGLVNIELYEISGTTAGTIISAYGKVMSSFILPGKYSGKNTRTLDLRNLPKGIYLIRFVNPNFNYSQKLVIE